MLLWPLRVFNSILADVKTHRYLQERERLQNIADQEFLRWQRSDSIIDSLKTAAHHLYSSTAAGLQDLFSAPAQGYNEDGFLGFAEGAAVGLVSALARPVEGVARAGMDIAAGARRKFAAEGGASDGTASRSSTYAESSIHFASFKNFQLSKFW